VTTGSLGGAGNFSANGGAGAGAGGGGAGGRVCVYFGSSDYTGPITVQGGSGYGTGGTGTSCQVHDPYLNPNQPPLADAGGPYSVIVNGTVTLDASNTSDPDQSAASLIYQWDLDGDGVFGETGGLGSRGDETGITPTFVATGLPALNSVTVRLRVTDNGGLPSEDTATIEIIHAPDLTIVPGSIRFVPVNPGPGEPVVIQADVKNQGLVRAANIAVRLADFGVPIGSHTIANLEPGETVTVSFDPVSFPESLRLITVAADPNNAIAESIETNNQSSNVLQVGSPDISVFGVFLEAELDQLSACAGQPAIVRGDAWYDFIAVPGDQDFPAQGNLVTVTVRDLFGAIVGVFSGSHTDTGGGIGQGIIAPGATGTYVIKAEITDFTLTGFGETIMTVSECPGAPPPVPGGPPSGGAIPPDGGGGTSPGNGSPGPIDDPTPQCGDAWVFSEDILFSEQPEQIGQTVFVIAFTHYQGAGADCEVPGEINDIFPLAGSLQTVPIASTLVNFDASPGAPIFVTFAVPWTPTADGPHIIQVSLDPQWTQFEGNDEATRLISVGTPPDFLAINKSVVLAIDADGNQIASPGDTLEYTITYVNTGANDLTGGVIFDDFAERYLVSPLADSAGGTENNGTITWNVGTIAAGTGGSITYRAAIKPAAEFPGGLTRVVNTALLDTNETVPVAARARISVLGDAIPPVTTAALDPSAGAAGWHKTDVTVNLSAVDNPSGSGVRRIIYSIDGGPAVSVMATTAEFTISAEGQHTIVFQAVDVVGNYEAPQTIHVNVDKTLPVPAAGGPYVVPEGSTISLDASSSFDALSGIDRIEWDLDGDLAFDDANPAGFLGLDGPGVHHISFRVIDRAGNFAVAQAEVEVLNVAPEILSLNLSAASIDEGQSVTASGTLTDPALGVATETFTGTATWSDGVTTDVTISGNSFSTTRTFPDDDPDSGTLFDVFTVAITIRDDDGGTNTATSAALTVDNVAPAIALISLSSASIDEGQSVIVTGQFTDPALGVATETFSGTAIWSDGVSTDLTIESDGTFSTTRSFADDDPVGTASDYFTVTVTINDDDQGSDVATSGQLTVNNVAPELVSLDLSAAAIDENGILTLTGAIADLGLLDTHTVVINWGVGEGSTTIELAAGAVGFSASHQYLDDSPASTTSDVYGITVSVSDDDGGSDTDGTTITVSDVAPVITGSISGPTAAVPGQPLAYSIAGFSDVGSLDTHTTAWEIRDASNTLVAAGSGLSLNFTPSAPGTYSVKFMVTDDDSLSDFETRTLDVSFAGTQVGTCGAGTGTALVVGGLMVNDRIHVNPMGNNGTLQVQITDRTTGTLVHEQTIAAPAGGFARIVIFGQAADDYVQIAGSISVPACVFAGAGNDNVKGGDGPDILMGGDGDDMLIGGGGRDLMIGGFGADRLVGNTDEDILIAGITAHDNNDAALSAILKEWTSSGTNSVRIANIMAGTGLTGGFRLVGDDGANQTVFNDNNADTLTGSQGIDWFFANRVADGGGVLDTVTDQAASELWNDTDF
jgi:hypothetical protein